MSELQTKDKSAKKGKRYMVFPDKHQIVLFSISRNMVKERINSESKHYLSVGIGVPDEISDSGKAFFSCDNWQVQPMRGEHPNPKFCNVVLKSNSPLTVKVIKGLNGRKIGVDYIEKDCFQEIEMRPIDLAKAYDARIDLDIATRRAKKAASVVPDYMKDLPFAFGDENDEKFGLGE